MKRFMVLVLCLALAFTAVSAQAVSLAKVVGRWYFISVDGAGLAGDSYVEFNRDKTVALIVAGQAKDMTGLEWKVSDDTIRISKGGALSAYSLDYADDILTLRTRELSELSGSTLDKLLFLARHYDRTPDELTLDLLHAAILLTWCLRGRIRSWKHEGTFRYLLSFLMFLAEFGYFVWLLYVAYHSANLLSPSRIPMAGRKP